MERILVGIDFSAPSRTAAQWAAEQFGEDAEIILMHAVHLCTPPAVVGGAPERQIQDVETSRRGAQTRLAELRSTLPGKRIRARIRVGQPADALARSAWEIGASVVIVGEASARTGLYRVLGGTVEALIRRSSVPVLLHRGQAAARPTRIVAAIDGSPRTAHVLDEAQRFGTRFKAEVTVFQVVEASLVGAVGIAAAEGERRRTVQQVETSAAVRAEVGAATLRAAGVWAEAMTASGDVAATILRVARELSADLIIVGLRHPGRLERALVGCIAHDVLREADCSVLVALGQD